MLSLCTITVTRGPTQYCVLFNRNKEKGLALFKKDKKINIRVWVCVNICLLQYFILKGSAASSRESIKCDVTREALSACESARVHFSVNFISHDALDWTNYKLSLLPLLRMRAAHCKRTRESDGKAKDYNRAGACAVYFNGSLNLLPPVKMAAQVDLVSAKVEEEMLGVTLKRLIKEKKRKKRDALPAADKSERREKDARKAKLHHYQHAAEHRSLQPQQLEPQKPKAQNFSAGKPVILSQNHGHHHPNQSHLPPGLRPPEPRLLQRQRKRTVPPEAPALFTFTPLKTFKIRNQDFHDKQRDKTLNLAVKKENTEANVKHAEVKQKKGGFLFTSLFIFSQNSPFRTVFQAHSYLFLTAYSPFCNFLLLGGCVGVFHHSLHQTVYYEIYCNHLHLKKQSQPLSVN